MQIYAGNVSNVFIEVSRRTMSEKCVMRYQWFINNNRPIVDVHVEIVNL